jgi:probable addiction module antidote protein
MKVSESYRAGLLKRLKSDRKFALAYLNECLKDSSESAFLLGLRDVAEAYGFKQLAGKAHISREHLFRMLSRHGNPRLDNLRSLASALGWQLAFTEKKRFRKAA